MTNPRRRNTTGGSRPLDEVRARRSGAAAAGGTVAGPGMSVDGSGRIVPSLGDALYVDNAGNQQVRVDGETLQIVTGSPTRIAGVIKPKEVAEVRAATVTNATAIADVDQRQTDALIAARARITALEQASFARGVAVLVAGTVAVAIVGIPSDAIVVHGVGPVSANPGFISFAIGVDTLTFTSSDPLDTSTIHYHVMTAPT